MRAGEQYVAIILVDIDNVCVLVGVEFAYKLEGTFCLTIFVLQE